MYLPPNASSLIPWPPRQRGVYEIYPNSKYYPKLTWRPAASFVGTTSITTWSAGKYQQLFRDAGTSTESARSHLLRGHGLASSVCTNDHFAPPHVFPPPVRATSSPMITPCTPLHWSLRAWFIARWLASVVASTAAGATHYTSRLAATTSSSACAGVRCYGVVCREELAL